LSQKDLAKKLNIDQTVLSRTLRYELAEEEKMKFIDELKKVVK
jgi:ribosome-binding protein aMBF1 (putative translation factor)